MDEIDMERMKEKLEPVKIQIEQTQNSIENVKSTIIEITKDPTMTTCSEIVQDARSTFYSGKTRPLEFRVKQLKLLKKILTDHANDLGTALHTDLRRHKFENSLLEIDLTVAHVDEMLHNINEWAAPDKPRKDLINLLDEIVIHKDPYGVVLVIGSWNYPLQLTLIPFMGAIAAGNCVILKPSEHAPATANILQQLITRYLDNECYKVVCGGVRETTELLNEKLDYIFYTGSANVGRLVREASNKFLTPVTLELGGKSPVYIDNTANMMLSVRRILWGKFMNFGQTCIAPDYLICSREVQDEFVRCAKLVIEEFYGENPQQSPDLARIINQQHFQRVVGLMSNCEIAIGGQTDASEKYVAPSVITNVKPSDPIMKSEIFGPLLPILVVNSVHEAIGYINERAKPLVMYIFTKDKKVKKQLISRVQCGAICVNDTVVQYCVSSLPFGGVGESGMGAYHGKLTFDTFVHHKGCLSKDFNPLVDLLIRYPPFNDRKLALVNFMMKKRRDLPLIGYLPYFFAFGLGVAATYGVNAFLKAHNSDVLL